MEMESLDENIEICHSSKSSQNLKVGVTNDPPYMLYINVRNEILQFQS